MSEPATTEPSTVRAGDGVTWRRDLPAYRPADGWVLKYRILWPSPPPSTFTAAADGDGHLVTLNATTTAAWQAGAASLLGWVEGPGGQRVTLLQQQLTVLQDLTAATSLDSRTAAERRLADAEAALSTYLASGRAHVAEYMIGGRRMVFRAATELRDIVNAARLDVARERARTAAAQGVARGRIYTRF